MVKQFIKILPLITLVLTSSCTKEENPCEECFDGVVQCKINGKKWSAKCNSSIFDGCTPYTCRYYLGQGSQFEFNASNSDDDTRLFMGVSSLLGGLKLGHNELGILRGTFGIKDSCGWYFTDSLKSRTIEILSIDTLNQIIEGNFNYSAIGECGTQVDITDGYFKVDYKLL